MESKTIVSKIQKHIPTCPHCGNTLNAHAGPGPRIPEPGDISICAKCVKPGIFAVTQEDELTVRMPLTEGEWDECAKAIKEALGEG